MSVSSFRKEVDVCLICDGNLVGTVTYVKPGGVDFVAISEDNAVETATYIYSSGVVGAVAYSSREAFSLIIIYKPRCDVGATGSEIRAQECGCGNGKEGIAEAEEVTSCEIECGVHLYLVPFSERYQR